MPRGLRPAVGPRGVHSPQVEQMAAGEADREPSPTDVSVLRAASGRFAGTLDKTLRSAIVPYGYTVTIWASGAYLISLRGVPAMLEAFAFVAGAIFAFGVLTGLSQRRRPEADPSAVRPPIHPDSSHPIFAAGLHVAAVGIAFVAASLVDETLGNAAWFFGPFVVTLVYLSIASAEMAIAIELNQREIRLRGARPQMWGRRRTDRLQAGAEDDGPAAEQWPSAGGAVAPAESQVGAASESAPPAGRRTGAGGGSAVR
jgi:hypothetical protein